MSSSDEKGKSLRWMIGVLMLAIAAVGWGFAASEYAAKVESARPDAPSYREARRAFFRNARTQIPNAAQVISHTFAEARWILYVFGGLEIGALVLGVVARRVERGLSEMENRHKVKRKPAR